MTRLAINARIGDKASLGSASREGSGSGLAPRENTFFRSDLVVRDQGYPQLEK